MKPETQVDTQDSASDTYKQRYVAYEKIYKDNWPEPPPMELGATTNPVAGAQSSALKRKVRYNDKGTTQNSTVKGATNATK